MGLSCFVFDMTTRRAQDGLQTDEPTLAGIAYLTIKACQQQSDSVSTFNCTETN